MVKVFDGLKFKGHGAIVTGLIGGFDVEIDEVVAGTEGVDGGLCLALEIGVVETRSTRHIDDAQAGIVTDAANEIDGGDDSALMDLLGETLGQGNHLRTVAPAPRPDARCHIFSLARAFLI